MIGAPLLKPMAEGEEPSVWVDPIRRAQMALQSQDQQALQASYDEINLALSNHPLRGRGKRVASFYQSLLRWTLTGEFDSSLRQLQTARIQLWHMESQWPPLEFQKLFVDCMIDRFGKERGFVMFRRIHDAVDPGATTGFYDDEDADVQVYRRPGAKLTILCLSGLNHRYAGIGWNSFDRCVAHALNANLIVLKDFSRRLYLRGIESIGSYPQTLAHVQTLLQEFKDTDIVATGGSGGVFAAINMACDLGITHAVCMSGPTSLAIGEDNEDRQVYQLIAEEVEAGLYQKPDLPAKVKASSLKRIEFFVAGKHEFDLSQMKNLADQTSAVVPHIYPDWSHHVVTDLALEDGTILDAFLARP